MMPLYTLAEETTFSPEQQTYLLGMLKEIAALEFVSELCQVAYDLGFDDALEEETNRPFDPWDDPV